MAMEMKTPMSALRCALKDRSARIRSLLLLAGLFLSACAPRDQASIAPAETSAPAAAPTAAPTAAAAATHDPSTVILESAAVVAYVQDGNLQVWDEATGTSQTIVDSGGVIRVELSDDGQIVAFLRRSVVGDLDSQWHEQSGLWAVDRNGENLRELVPADELRTLLHAAETDSSNIPQLAWVPGTHRLLFSGWTYFVQAEGESHAVPEGLYLADADELTHTTLVPAGTSLRFVPSPDGAYIALMSASSLSFVNADGSSQLPDALTYPEVGMLGPLFPSGVWTQDSRSFVVTGSLEQSPDTNFNFTIWRVPVDGSPPQSLAAITKSIVDSVTFSPDGLYAAYFRHAGPPGNPTDFGWYVTRLAAEAGSLAIPRSSDLFWKNLYWSPAGVAYAVAGRTLSQLCPDAAQDTEVCGPGFDLGGDPAGITWLDGNRFLYVTREPYDLYFGRLDGTRIRIAEGAENFAARPMTCRNDAELAVDSGSPTRLQSAPDIVLLTTWRVRNSGTCVWDPSYRLSYLGGDRLSGPRNVSLREAVPPGGEVELLVRVIAPAAPGAYRGQWQMVGPDGSPFGAVATVDIVVP
jgi:hypothetical protein